MASGSGTVLANEIRTLYQQGLTDYFMEPLVLADADENPLGQIRDGDAVIFCCRRGEREVQLTRSFVDPSFDEFERADLKNLTFVTLTLYHEMFLNMPVGVAFPPVHELKDTLGEVVSKSGLKQLRVAESEKFAHVTFFLNGNSNRVFPGEDHINVPSPKGVPFERIPELSSGEVAAEVISSLDRQEYDFIVVNFPNGDMIGHLESQEAKIKCAEAVDRQLGKVLEAAAVNGYAVVITADHGNLEAAFRADGSPNLSHTRNPVPFIIVEPDSKRKSGLDVKAEGTLADVAPTVLQIMGLPKPEVMGGRSLLGKSFNPASESKAVLVILDGWGLGASDASNHIFLADTPVWDMLISQHPFTRLDASGKSVGLLEWKEGNSEAGHQTIGAGRIVLQDDARIEEAIENGSFFENPVFDDALTAVFKQKGALHLIALLSEKSSHGSISYPLALLRLAKEKRLQKVFIHTVLDGRSTKIRSAPAFLIRLEKEMNELGVGEVASGIGRAFALDRDGDYMKTKRAYDALVFGLGRQISIKPKI